MIMKKMRNAGSGWKLKNEEMKNTTYIINDLHTDRVCAGERTVD